MILVCLIYKLEHELQVMAFISPKIIGGVTAPTPVGELGMVEMTQALQLSEVAFEQVWLGLSPRTTSRALCVTRKRPMMLQLCS